MLVMLDWCIYCFMNWLMVVSGFIYWWLVFDYCLCLLGCMMLGLCVFLLGIIMML